MTSQPRARGGPLEGDLASASVAGSPDAKAAQVDDVPAVLRLGGQRLRDGLANGRQIGGSGEDRGVVGVVRGAEEDGRRRVGHGAQRRALGVAERGSGGEIARLEFVAMHERRDADDAGRGRGWRRRGGRRAPRARAGAPAGAGLAPSAAATSTISSVWSWAVAPYASHHAR